MKIQGRVVVSDIFTSEKDVSYYNVVDLGSGGSFSFVLDGGGKLEGVKPGAMLDVNGEIKLNRVGKSTFITMVEGTSFTAVK